MAVRWAVQNGDWSNTATWNDGATLGIPTVGDDVFTNNFTVNVNQNITVNTLNNTASPITVPQIATPIMTSNSSPSGVANASANSTNAFIVFNQDGSYSNTWSVASSSGWISYMFPSGRIIKRYVVKNGTTTVNSPSAWTFQGSNDGLSWTTLETVASYSFTASGSYVSPVLSNINSYTFYRFNWTNSTGGSTVISEIEMTESTSSNVGGIIGGSFNFNTGGVTATLNTMTLGAANIITITASSGNINLTFLSDLSFNINFVSNITHSGNCNVTITSPNFYHSLTNGRVGFVKSSTSNLTINGNIIPASTNAGGTQDSGGFVIQNGGITTVNGNLYAGANSSNPAGGYFALRQNSGTVIVNGNIHSSINSNTTNRAFDGTAELVLNGNIVPNVGYALVLSNNAIINGNIIASTTLSPIISTGAISVTINGNVTASATANAISLTNSAAQVFLNGNMYNVDGRQAIYASRIWLSRSGTTEARFYTSGGQDRTLYSEDTFPNLPLESEVRSGTLFGPDNMLEGEVIIPSTNDVVNGVLVDNTTGNGLFTVQELLDELKVSTDPMAQRIRRSMTPEILTKIIEWRENQ